MFLEKQINEKDNNLLWNDFINKYFDNGNKWDYNSTLRTLDEDIGK